ncbi:iron-sulfur cluster biosynthesis family protein [Paenibacillus rhizovicinus]|uniref:Iron-sulfur cluster biosynthesis family protein n=1 Tax=Paenibacillus rhizovicinus TaxID=2704463 RepID=A0A6C0PCD5_9BACL|nr:iron-sulfur cluster biosynthesis family protein [Paenibacillus rhizovicinus]QHW34472.1 iron-sulfur cluster biosynthesis family protein [Paenibacillus rhizovicinus]
MHFTFSPSAVEQLSGPLSDGSKSLKLLYDTEGCGCVMSGVPTLLVVDEPEANDKLGSGSPYPVWYEPNYEVFFEPELKIDYNPSRNAFILKSDSQTYTPNLRLLNRNG